MKAAVQVWTDAHIAVLTTVYAEGGLLAARRAFPGRSDASIKGTTRRLRIRSATYAERAWSPGPAAILKAAFESGGLPAARGAFPDRTDNSIMGCVKRFGWKGAKVVKGPKVKKSTVPISKDCVDCGAKDFTLPINCSKVYKCRDEVACARRALKRGRA